MEKLTSKERKAAKKGRKLEELRQQIKLARGSRARGPAEVFFWGEGGQMMLEGLSEEDLWLELGRARHGHAPFGLNEVRVLERVDPPQEAQALDMPPLIECEMTTKKPVVPPQEAQTLVKAPLIVREMTVRKPVDPPREAQAPVMAQPVVQKTPAKKPADSPQEAQALVMALLVAREMTARKLADSPREAQAPVMAQAVVPPAKKPVHPLQEAQAPVTEQPAVPPAKKPADSPREAQAPVTAQPIVRGTSAKHPVDPPQEAQVLRMAGAAQRAGTSRVGLGCFYCWRQGHRKQDCEDLRADIARGLCRLGAGYRVVRLDGSELPFMWGKSLCERARSRLRAGNLGLGGHHRAEQLQGAQIVSVWTAVGRRNAPEAKSSRAPVQSNTDRLAARATKACEKEMGVRLRAPVLTANGHVDEAETRSTDAPAIVSSSTGEKEEEKGDSELQALRLRVRKLEETIDQLRRELAKQNRRGTRAGSVPEQEEDNEESGSDTATVTSSREAKARISTEVKREAEKRRQSTTNVDRTESAQAYGRADSATATDKGLGAQKHGWRASFFFENKGTAAS